MGSYQTSYRFVSCVIRIRIIQRACFYHTPCVCIPCTMHIRITDYEHLYIYRVEGIIFISNLITQGGRWISKGEPTKGGLFARAE